MNPECPNGWFMFTSLSYRAVTTKVPPFLWHRCALCTASFQQNSGFLRTPDIPVDHWQRRTLAVRFQSAHWDNENTMTKRWFLRHMASYRTPPVQMRQVVIAVIALSALVQRCCRWRKDSNIVSTKSAFKHRFQPLV